MKFNFKIWQLVSVLWLLIIFVQFERLIDITVLAYKYFELFFNDFNIALHVLDFRMMDTFLSLFIFISLPVLFFTLRGRFTFLLKNLNFSSFVVIILLFTFLLAPLITSTNPDFQKNISVTKHLSPMEKVQVLHLKSPDNSDYTQVNKFQTYKHNVIKEAFDESIIFADSIGETTLDKIFYYQKFIIKEISTDELVMKAGSPLITVKIFLLGTDEFGRDTFTRLIYGLRISVLVGLGAVLISFLLGISLGFTAGYKSGLADIVLNRTAELLLAFPVIYLVVLILALFSNSLFTVVVVLGISGWMSLFKIVRGEVISLKQKDYMITARLLGLKMTRLLFKEILPVIIAPVIVNLVFQFSNVVLAESALSYLGLGTGSDYPSWGGMIQSGQEYISKAWWMIVFPGGCLVLTLFAANDFGRRLNKVFNPRLKL